MSALRNHKLAGFSVERLMMFLNAVGQDIDIVIGTRSAVAAGRPHYGGRGLKPSAMRSTSDVDVLGTA